MHTSLRKKLSPDNTMHPNVNRTGHKSHNRIEIILDIVDGFMGIKTYSRIFAPMFINEV